LQEEIIKKTNDLTIFAWAKNSSAVPQQQTHGILATSPADFKDVCKILTGDSFKFGNDFAMTDKGLRFVSGLSGEGNRKALVLNCCYKDRDHQAGIYLTQLGASLYVRESPDSLGLNQKWDILLEPSFQPEKEVFVSKRVFENSAENAHKAHHNAFRLGDNIFGDNIWLLNSVRPESLFDSLRRMFITYGMRSFTGIANFNFKHGGYQGYALWFGIHDSQAWVSILTISQQADLLLEAWQ
jgi:hypothetical protein